jgi:DUF4097 and DUF4098 domain-containing protein YvlB
MEPVRVTATSGRIEVTAEVRDDVRVERGQEHPLGELLEVKGESAGVVLRVPIGTDLIVGSHSGGVRLAGPLGSVRITTRSGSVAIEQCTGLDARTVSGRVDVGSIDGDAHIRVGSGRITIEHIGGELTATSVSGRITVTHAAGPVQATSVNGRVAIGMDRAADVRCESVSGRVELVLPDGTRPNASMRSVTGRSECSLDDGDDCRVWCRTVSGRISLRGR